jgi:hypothetical protein
VNGQNQQKNPGKYARYFLGAAVIGAGLAGLWLAARDYLQAIDQLGLRVGERLSPRLALGLVGLEVFLGMILLGILWILSVEYNHTVEYNHRQTERMPRMPRWIIETRARIGWLRWLLAGLVILIPVWVLQHLALSAALGFSARLILTLGMGLALAILFTRDSSRLVRTSSLIGSWLIIASIFTFCQAMVGVTTYPFSLGWSEGNRIWDYSARFGHRFYNYPAGEPIFAYIDIGRQTLWGLPFLFARIPIWGMRLWNGIVSTVPYAILGWVVFQRMHRLDSTEKNTSVWFLCGLWTFLFLNQGPIYTPLVLSAILVAIAWRRPLWVAIPLIVAAGYYAQITRFTWMFAPAIWAVMLFFSDVPADVKAARKWKWGESIAVGLAGLIGGYLIPNRASLGRIAESFFAAENTQIPSAATVGSTAGGYDVATLSGLSAMVGRQPLLWERLLPNPTFGPGILLALLIAVSPLIALLIYLIATRRWKLDILRGAAILLPLLAFLTVGLIASVKIGGGGDLHNMDMFLVTLVLVAGLAWRAGGYQIFDHLEQQPAWVKGVLVLMMIIFAQQALLDSTPVHIPAAAKARDALEFIQNETVKAAEHGEVLFMDQRQLLTFGNVPAIPLVIDYEKKYLMDQALSNNAAYFSKFHQDLAKQRFALIVSEPLKVIFQGEEHQFGNENDAWVKWVSQPVLCYYEPLKTFKEVKVQLLVPKANPGKCP